MVSDSNEQQKLSASILCEDPFSSATCFLTDHMMDVFSVTSGRNKIQGSAFLRGSLMGNNEYNIQKVDSKPKAAKANCP